MIFVGFGCVLRVLCVRVYHQFYDTTTSSSFSFSCIFAGFFRFHFYENEISQKRDSQITHRLSWVIFGKQNVSVVRVGLINEENKANQAVQFVCFVNIVSSISPKRMVDVRQSDDGITQIKVRHSEIPVVFRGELLTDRYAWRRIESRIHEN